MCAQEQYTKYTIGTYPSSRSCTQTVAAVWTDAYHLPPVALERASLTFSCSACIAKWTRKGCMDTDNFMIELVTIQYMKIPYLPPHAYLEFGRDRHLLSMGRVRLAPAATLRFAE